MVRIVVLFAILAAAGVRSAAAQPALSAAPNVVPAGSATTITITGTPGHYVGVGGSSLGAGMTYGGIPLALGADARVITVLQLPGSGQATISVVPPFKGTALDRFYVQAVSSPSSSLMPPTASNSLILRNADVLGAPVSGDLTGTFPHLTIGPGAAASIVQAINTGGPINFTNGFSMNATRITNLGSPAAPGDAVNRAYADANYIKFVPGAEQLSVGDANGSATMLNLRGGSTCCTPPGGHTPAFFKVFQNGSFVFTGNLGIGTSPMEGPGYRTSWHTYKGAFRSGYAATEWNDDNVGFFSWAGGSNSTALGLYAFAFGDTNYALSTSSIAFGSGNEVKGAAGFSAGAGNRVCDTYGVALGNNARSGGPFINGRCDPETFNLHGLGAVAIGYNVTAEHDHTMALGKFASSNGYSGTFVWSDGSAQQSADTFRNAANNEFAARAAGGFRFRTNLGATTGCNLPAGSGVWNCTSSRRTKENFAAVDGEALLTRLGGVPVSTWNYMDEAGGVRHIGPMAEDFYSAFELGTDNASIGVQDLASVSLAAAQALDARTRALAVENKELREETAALRAEIEELKALVKIRRE